MNIIQSLFQNIQPPDAPPHVGEAFHIWTYCVEVGEARALLLLMLNHVTDPELKELIEHFIADVLEPQFKQCKSFMTDEGILLPEISRDAVKADHNQIPPGAHLPDVQSAQLVVVKVAGLLEYSNRGLVSSLRDDMGAMFYTFHHHVAAQGLVLKKLLAKKGWLRVPPPHVGRASVSDK
jgi:hypothetical protein